MRKRFLEEMFEALPPAMQAGRGHSACESWRPLIQKARQVSRYRRRFRLLFERRFEAGRVVQRLLRVNHALVNLAHRGQVFVQAPRQGIGVERLSRRRRRHLARQQAQRLRIDRKRVRLPVVFQLQTVLQVAQELVSRREARIFGSREQPFVAQPEQREHGAAVPHPRLAAAVQPLQALHQELDVANAAGRKLDVDAAHAPPRGHLFADPLPRLGYRFHRPEIERGLVNQRLHELQQRRARLRLACRHARLDQHLLLPVARPPAVVISRALAGNRHLAQRPVRAQPQIHAVTLAFGGVSG